MVLIITAISVLPIYVLSSGGDMLLIAEGAGRAARSISRSLVH
jgi:hypothetical protein